MKFFKFAVVFMTCIATSVYAEDHANANSSETKVTMQETSNASKPGKSFIANTVINSSVDQVCHTVLNYADYPSFMPNIDKVQIKEAGESSTVLDMQLKLPLNTIKKYRLKMQQSVDADHCKVSWKLVPWEGLKPSETIADAEGYWLLTPKDNDGKQVTAVKYVAYTDPGEVPTGFGWIVDKMSKDGIPKTIEAVRLKTKQ